MKTGSTGVLCFVSVEHLITTARGTAVRERQDIVYRDMSTAQPAALAKAPPPPPVAKHRESHMADPVLLFRYSALTFNGHRIHYDRQYCTEVEGYPGLVFHGPLTATLLFDLALERNPGCWVSGFEFRAVSPLFDLEPFTLAGCREDDRAELWARTPQGGLAMTAKAEFA
jgi:3-methylfumaryl-CoA hydratase